jgi:hypothetical protein
MKGLLLMLMALASVATAQIQQKMSDAEMKALLIGAWETNVGTTNTFTADGRWIVGDPEFPNASEKDETQGWDIKHGELIQIRTPAADRPFTILFLTQHECLLHWTHHDGGYALWTR